MSRKDDPLGVTQSIKFNTRLKAMDTPEDIPAHWLGSPIAELIGSHNFGQKIEVTGEPRMLISTCIEFRYRPAVPSQYAYVIRRASGRLIGAEFALVYALSRGVKHVVLIAHNDCGMTKVTQHKPAMIATLVEQGWDPERAEEFVAMHAGRYHIEDEVDSLKREFYRLKRLFKNVEIAPLFVSLSSNRLHVPNWYLDFVKKPDLGNANECVPAEEYLMLP
ncbi:hypothetical protein KA344_09810 [bacterium]|jgi:carbonic anhydrase|nr:hypothetical protein [bacterium]